MKAPRLNPIMEPWLTLVIIVSLGVLPALYYMGRIRRQERTDREPLKIVLRAFGYGASFGVILGLLFSVIFDLGLVLLGVDTDRSGLAYGAIVIAPVAEEISKGIGVFMMRRRIWEAEDGYVYGAAVGLGFAATENLLYGITAFMAGGLQEAVIVLGARSVTSTLLHAVTTALLGGAMSIAWTKGDSALTALPVLIVAMLIHSLYNALAVQGALWALAVALVLVVGLYSYIKLRIRTLDVIRHGSRS